MFQSGFFVNRCTQVKHQGRDKKHVVSQFIKCHKSGDWKGKNITDGNKEVSELEYKRGKQQYYWS